MIVRCYFCDGDADFRSSGVPSCAPCRRTHDLEEAKPKEDSAPSKSVALLPDEDLPGGDSFYDEAEEPCSLDCPACLTLAAARRPGWVDPTMPAQPALPNHTFASPSGTGCTDDCPRCKAEGFDPKALPRISASKRYGEYIARFPKSWTRSP